VQIKPNKQSSIKILEEVQIRYLEMQVNRINDPDNKQPENPKPSLVAV
jgi:hypothetical protein